MPGAVTDKWPTAASASGASSSARATDAAVMRAERLELPRSPHRISGRARRERAFLMVEPNPANRHVRPGRIGGREPLRPELLLPRRPLRRWHARETSYPFAGSGVVAQVDVHDRVWERLAKDARYADGNEVGAWVYGERSGSAGCDSRLHHHAATPTGLTPLSAGQVGRRTGVDLRGQVDSLVVLA